MSSLEGSAVERAIELRLQGFSVSEITEIVQVDFGQQPDRATLLHIFARDPRTCRVSESQKQGDHPGVESQSQSEYRSAAGFQNSFTPGEGAPGQPSVRVEDVHYDRSLSPPLPRPRAPSPARQYGFQLRSGPPPFRRVAQPYHQRLNDALISVQEPNGAGERLNDVDFGWEEEDPDSVQLTYRDLLMNHPELNWSDSACRDRERYGRRRHR